MLSHCVYVISCQYCRQKSTELLGTDVGKEADVYCQETWYLSQPHLGRQWWSSELPKLLRPDNHDKSSAVMLMSCYLCKNHSSPHSAIEACLWWIHIYNIYAEHGFEESACLKRGILKRLAVFACNPVRAMRWSKPDNQIELDHKHTNIVTCIHT